MSLEGLGKFSKKALQNFAGVSYRAFWVTQPRSLKEHCKILQGGGASRYREMDPQGSLRVPTGFTQGSHRVPTGGLQGNTGEIGGLFFAKRETKDRDMCTRWFRIYVTICQMSDVQWMEMRTTRHTVGWRSNRGDVDE